MPILGLTGPYPTFQQVMILARSYVNDTFMGATGTAGEGQIFTNNAPCTIPVLRAVVAELYQELGNAGAGVVIRDNYIFDNVTPLQGRFGVGIPDPGVQVNISYQGYFDGQQMHAEIFLPPDLITPLFMRERTTGTNNEFEDMHEVQNGLHSAKQTTAMAFWEFRGDAIWMPGCLLPKDLRLRYVCSLPLLEASADLNSVKVPITDCENALALKLARNYGLPRGSDQVQLADAMQKEATFLLKNRFIRAQQAIDFRAEPYGDNRLNLFPLDTYR